MDPVRVQSMANTPTHNVEQSIKQAIEIIEAGGELVRFTVINAKDAEALNNIKQGLVERGFQTPVVADVHFNPNLADIAAQYVDKVRINPGNYIDKRATFKQIDFTDEEYQLELDRIETRFSKFLDICVSNKTAVRIGTNHGSLSDRIMSRYGDTPHGMVEATMEFLRICHKKNFTNVVVSLKSSNTRVMVYAYRFLAREMQIEGLQFGLHLGVTEAGSGEDGRIKSAVGIGALMHDGLGDTIRVSLTEHPAHEIPIAKKLVSHMSKFEQIPALSQDRPLWSPYDYNKRQVLPVFSETCVVADISSESELKPGIFEQLGFVYNVNNNSLFAGDLSPDYIYVGEQPVVTKFEGKTKILIDSKYWEDQPGTIPLFSIDEYLLTQIKSPEQNWVQINYQQLTPDLLLFLQSDPTIVIVAYSFHKNYVQELRLLINTLMAKHIKSPVVLQMAYTDPDPESFQLKCAADCGLFFIDGLADGVWLKNTFSKNNQRTVETSFGILQACRTRISKTEYISCPGCGRTLFDLERSLSEIKNATGHLKGLKIAVMGCIVNGPGEMADADYGYVGSGPGKVSLYKGKTMVLPNIPTNEAVEKLLVFIENDRTNN